MSNEQSSFFFGGGASRLHAGRHWVAPALVISDRDIYDQMTSHQLASSFLEVCSEDRLGSPS